MTDEKNRPFTAASFNQFLTEGKLMGSRCTACEAVYLPPRPICSRCHSDQMQWVEVPGEGKLAAFTAIHIAPSSMIAEGFGRDHPYVSGVVELNGGLRISARILGVDARNPAGIPVGLPLTVEFLITGESENQRTVLAFTAKE